MAKKTDNAPDGLSPDDAESWLGGLVADEADLDRPSLWRLGMWGFTAIGALVVGIMAAQAPVNAQRTQFAATEIANHTQKIDLAVRESQLESRRLSAAIETLGSDRDRLFTRLSAIEQGLDTVTGSIRKIDERPTAPSATTTSWPNATTAPVLTSPPATSAAPQTGPATATQAPIQVTPQAAASAADSAPTGDPERTEIVVARAEPKADDIPLTPPSVIQAAPIVDADQTATETHVQPTGEAAARADVGVDLGSAHSMDGLRALWRGVSGAHKAQFDGLRPVIAVQERKNGLGVQLRLIAGPIKDATSAARICAALAKTNRNCTTAAFEGQRLSILDKPADSSPAPRKPKPKAAQVQPPPVPAPPPVQSEKKFSLFGSGTN
jgi:hypothetical protein